MPGILAVALATAVLAAADPPPTADLTPLMCQRGRVIIDESFAGPEALKKWNRYKGTYEVVDGQLRAAEVASDGHHPALSRRVDATNLMVQFAFRIDGAKWQGFAFDDKEHVARAMLGPDSFRILKMSGIGGTTKGESLDSIKVKFDPARWYTMLIELSGDEYLAQIDNQYVLYGEAAGVGGKKSRIELINGGQWAWYDSIKVWEAEPNPAWAAKKPQVIEAKAKRSGGRK